MLDRRFLTVLVLALTALPLMAGELPKAAPEDVGLSSQRLARVGERFESYVESGEIVGALGMVSRRGKVVYQETWGERDRENGLPMTEDTLFRIYSMSKPITSVGVMILYEEGRLRLRDPVSKYLPEFAEMEVLLATEDSETGETKIGRKPATRQITVRDLLRHTAGLSYGFFGNTPVDKLYREAGVLSEQEDLGELVRAIGEMPLLFEPGRRWHYSVATDVLGRLIEVVSGERFEDFLSARIFTPLGMDDTSFTVPASKVERFAQLYSPEGTGSDAELFLKAQTSQKVSPQLAVAPAEINEDFQAGATFQSGGGGLVSTADDYMRFCLMLLNGGELDGKRVLSRKSVELMRADHMGDVAEPYRGGAYGFGLGFAVVTDVGMTGRLASLGEHSWAGAAGTSFWIDPVEEMVGIFMIQILPHTGLEYRDEFRLLAYQSIVD